MLSASSARLDIKGIADDAQAKPSLPHLSSHHFDMPDISIFNETGDSVRVSLGIGTAAVYYDNNVLNRGSFKAHVASVHTLPTQCSCLLMLVNLILDIIFM